MTTARHKILSKAKKIKELAVRGIGGEKDTAKTMLDIYMKKHNISESELEDYNKQNTSTDDLISISDEEFMREMFKELIPIGIGLLFSKYADSKTKEKASIDSVNFFLKYANAAMIRTNNKKNK